MDKKIIIALSSLGVGILIVPLIVTLFLDLPIFLTTIGIEFFLWSGLLITGKIINSKREKQELSNINNTKNVKISEFSTKDNENNKISNKDIENINESSYIKNNDKEL